MPKGPQRQLSHVDRIWQRFDPDALARICQMPEKQFAEAYGMEVHEVEQRSPADFYAFKDNGSNILAVAHLDTVSAAGSRQCNFVDTEAGWVVHSRALDDRLGAYVILDLLPKLGMKFDTLLTVGEEAGRSTASFFESPKKYDWVIEFDRGGSDVVMYQYEDDDTVELVEASGARVGFGSFSDIAYLEHLGVKAFNWGVGYQDYHSARSHAYLEDTVEMVDHFIRFHDANKDTHLPHEKVDKSGWGGLGGARRYAGPTVEELRARYGAWLDEPWDDDGYYDDDTEMGRLDSLDQDPAQLTADDIFDPGITQYTDIDTVKD